MADEKTKCRRKRGIFRGSCTKIVHEMRELLDDQEINDLGRNRLSALKNNLVDKLERIKEIDGKLEEILVADEGDEYEKEMNDIIEFHDQFYDLFVQIDVLFSAGSFAASSLKSVSVVDGENVTESGIRNLQLNDEESRRLRSLLNDDDNKNQYHHNHANSNINEHFRNNIHINARLPPVDIDPFEGDPLLYPSFMNAFEAMIDNNTNLAEVQKFCYLRGLVKGKAKTTIDGFVYTDGNYREALNLLKERFGDTKLLQASFIGSLMDLKGVSDAKDTKGLRYLHDKIETYIRNLKSLNIINLIHLLLFLIHHPFFQLYIHTTH